MPCAENEDDGDDLASLAQGLSRECRIVLVSGFESFNVELYKKVHNLDWTFMPWSACSLTHHVPSRSNHAAALCGMGRLVRSCDSIKICCPTSSTLLDMQAARRVKSECPGINVEVFSDRDISDKKGEMEAALQGADVFFGSLLFDYDQVGGVSGFHQLFASPK